MVQDLTIVEDLKIGRRIYFEDETYQGDGIVHYLPNEEERQFFMELDGEPSISVKPIGGKPRFVPLSQIILL